MIRAGGAASELSEPPEEEAEGGAAAAAAFFRVSLPCFFSLVFLLAFLPCRSSPALREAVLPSMLLVVALALDPFLSAPASSSSLSSLLVSS